MVYVRFERGRDNVIGPTYGPFEYLQVTYETLRAPVPHDGGELELAVKPDYDGDWILSDKEAPETVFSDFIIYSA